ncbi:hypothetical protein O181_036945 [Austropuccinia psidii MF-1]|uniref:Uncharacterized protein n=1 Tax=Austropuccinia psidii MF-1 TaxID=1389203 RepID=A0A9Q3HCM8_9BASI|nr:hypothetical protein [Austropuccinia psidii MF-1]
MLKWVVIKLWQDFCQLYVDFCLCCLLSPCLPSVLWIPCTGRVNCRYRLNDDELDDIARNYHRCIDPSRSRQLVAAQNSKITPQLVVFIQRNL